MAGKAKPIPDGFHTLTPHLVVRDATKTIEFYKTAFGAELLGEVHYTPGGEVMHASLKIGDSILMLNDEFPDWGALSPVSRGGASVTMHMYVEDADAAFNRAVAAGASVKMPLMDAFWGSRYGQVVDPFGHQWSIATHKRDVTKEELEQAARAAFAAGGK